MLSTVLINGFPIGNCQRASAFLAFHYRQQLNEINITLVCASGKNGVSHCWLEIDGYVFDITGDQYNHLSNSQLNARVIKQRPYPKVHVEKVSQSYLY